jgi:hypothetical protein
MLMNTSYLKAIIAVLVFGLLAGCGADQTAQMSDRGNDTLAAQGESAMAETQTQPQAEVAETQPETPATPNTNTTTAVQPKPKAKPAMMTVQLPESTAITITLVDSIDSDIHVSGDRFMAQLAEPIVVNGKTCFAAGAQVVGIVDSVVESGRLKTPAELTIHVVSIADANGNPMPVSTYAIFEKKAGKTGRDAAIIGGGAVVGGIIGKITGKKGGTEIGAIAGAAAGAGAAAATGKDDIVHSAGTQMTFFLAEPLSLAVPE